MGFSETSASESVVPLSAAPYGAALQVCFFALGERVAKPLRDVGVREGAQLRIISSHQRLIVGLGPSRIAIAADVAAGVFVEEVSCDDHVEGPQAQ